MERGSDKHSARLDDEMAHEVRGIIQGGKDTHAEEFKQPEPSGEDQPDVDLVPDGTLHGGVPEGMTDADVSRRTQLATYLHRSAFPMVREMVIDEAQRNEAPDDVVADLRRLPAGREFVNVGDVFATLGGAEETQRF